MHVEYRCLGWVYVGCDSARVIHPAGRLLYHDTTTAHVDAMVDVATHTVTMRRQGSVFTRQRQALHPGLPHPQESKLRYRHELPLAA